ncbi:MAG: M23 family metallopeptidase [Salinivirgaceae bacterium]
MGKKEKKKKVLSRLKRHYRLVILNDQTFEEKWSYRLTGINVLTAISGLAMVLIFIGVVLMSFTPLKQLIPEYPDSAFFEKMVKNAVRIDSIENELAIRDQYIRNLRHILIGDSRTKVEDVHDTVELYSDLDLKPSKDDSLLRRRVELDQQASITTPTKSKTADKLSQMNFFSPVKGVVSNTFNHGTGHFGIDIVTEIASPVHAALAGTVISSSWSLKTGHTLQIQHSSNIITVYKHNESLIKEQGDVVSAGETVAFVGNSGEYSTGPHLHFELWHNGLPLNPQNYINFE